MGKIRELREAYVQGVLALKKCPAGHNAARCPACHRHANAKAAEVYPFKVTRPREVQPEIESSVRYRVFEGRLQYSCGTGRWFEWYDAEQTAQLRDLLNNPTETVELDDND